MISCDRRDEKDGREKMGKIKGGRRVLVKMGWKWR